MVGLVTVRVVLGEDSFLVREGLNELLQSSPSVDIVAASELPNALAARKPPRCLSALP